MANNRPETLLTTIKAIAEFALMIIGIIGIAIEIFNDQGLLKQLVNKLMDAAFSSSMAAIVGGLVMIVLGRIWYNKVFTKAENSNALGNFLMKAMMLVGAYFLYLFITTGSFRL